MDAWYNTTETRQRDSQDINVINTWLLLCDGSDIIMTSNMWTDVGFHNTEKVKVVDFLYKIPKGPQHP